MPESAQSFAASGESLDPATEAEWIRLRQQLELAEGFWLGFVFTSSPSGAAALRRRAERVLRSKARSLHPILLQEATQLHAVVAAVTSPVAAAAGCTWVEALRADAAGTTLWTDAWDDMFLRVNERRDAIRRRLQGGLLFVALPSLKPRIRDAAPDLWSVRSIVLDLPAAPAPPTSFQRSPEEESTSTLITPLPPAHDRRFALEEAQRRGQRAGRISDVRSRALAQARAAAQTAMALLNAGQHREAIRQASEATYALERFPDLNPFELAAAYALWSAADEADGDPAAAAEHLERALALTEGTGERRRLEWLERAFRLAQRHGDAGASLQFAAQMVALARQRVAAEDSSGAMRDLSVSLDNVGDVRRAAGDLPAATAAYEESLAIRRRMLTAFGETPQALRDLSVSLDKVGDVRRTAGDLPAATAAYEESLAIRRRMLTAFGEAPQALRDLSVSLHNVGNVRRAAGDLPAATAAYEESLAIRRRILTAFGETPEALRDLSVSLNNVGDVRRAAGDLPDAAAAYKESLDIDRQIDVKYGASPQALRDLSVSLRKVSELRRDAGDTAGSVALEEERVRVQERLAGLQPPAAPR